MSNPLVITNLSVDQLQKLQKELCDRVLIIKFGAEWCGPCKRIAPLYHKFIKSNPPNIVFADINVDDNIDLYMSLKRNKMINGVPVFFAFHGGAKRDKWFIPEDSIVGADEEQVVQFFARCQAKANVKTNQTQQTSTYSYEDDVQGGYTYYT